eukprot:jgi/Tetstr1/443133/TSEL_031189.t1
MTFIGKLGHTFKAFGSKVAGAASYLGHKVGSGLMTLAPAISVLNPTVGAGFAAAGAAAQGIGVLGDVGKKALSGGGVDFGQAKAAYGQTVPAYNGTTFGGQQTILINIPCGRRGHYLNTRMSHLRFSVKNKHAANSLQPDYTASSFIRSVSLYHGANLLEQIHEYNALYHLMFDIQSSDEELLGGGSILYGSNEDEDSHYREGVGIAAGTTAYFCIPIMSGIIGGLQSKYLPTGAMTGGDLRLELTLAATNAAVVGTAPDWEIGNVELQLEFVEVTSEVDRMIQHANPRYVISYESFANYTNSIQANEGQINKLIPARFSSLKTLYTIFRNGGSASGTFAIGQNLEVLSHKSTLTESGKNTLNTNCYLLGTVTPGSTAYQFSTRMTVHRIFVSSEQRTSGHRGDFVVDTSKEFARFDSRRVMCAVEFCDVVRYTSEGDGYVANPANSSGLLLEAPDLRAANSYESWSGNSSCALTLLQNYASAGVYGLAHDVPYVRRKHIGVEVDFDFVKRLGSMRFRLRRCASEFGAGDDFSLVSESDDLEAWAFQLVFWEPCKCLLMQPFAYDFFRAWVSSEQGRGSIVDCRIPVMLNTSRSVDTSEGKWMVALEFYTPLLCAKDPADKPHSVVLACPTLVGSDDRHILGHLGKSYRTGEESMYGQRYSIKPGSRDVAGHELRVSIDSLTELHLQLRDAVSLALLDPLEFQPGYVMSLVFYRTK